MADDLQKVVITGVGMVTPLGDNPRAVLRGIQAGESAAAAPTGFDAHLFACPLSAEIREFKPQQYVSEAKMVRLMNRDAQLAVAAARLALVDAGVKPGATYHSGDIALFGATGLAGLPLREVIPLIRVSASASGEFDPGKFGQAGLKAVSPILSFKILSNMPFCFVSINEGIQGVNGIYTPWEGQGAQAVEAGIRALQAGDARCVLAGGCDVKTHELAFATLEQQGLFDSWRKSGKGIVPGEGAVFLVLELSQIALARGARVYGQVSRFSLRSHTHGEDKSQTRAEVLHHLEIAGGLGTVLNSANGDEDWDQEEEKILEAARISPDVMFHPKKQIGDLFAAAGVLQIALGVLAVEQSKKRVLVNCFGHGSEQAAFVLDPA